MASEKVVYWLDTSEKIIAVNTSWDHFARENDGEDFMEAQVVGKSIWSFISGDPTRMWLDTLIAYTRISGKSVTREYRCDSPETKRFMEMSILPESDKQIRLTHRVLKEEEMSPPVSFQAAKDRLSSLCFRCSICNRVQIQGQWQEADIAASGGLLSTASATRVVYRVCESCRDNISAYRRGAGA
ncbi:MAG: hypothetical protein MI747_01675 [Desulfobacterales bacterium]|nr:hypothetical protein [Desulfobacterales bacterium]